jgi:hypothetical protein
MKGYTYGEGEREREREKHSPERRQRNRTTIETDTHILFISGHVPNALRDVLKTVFVEVEPFQPL